MASREYKPPKAEEEEEEEEEPEAKRPKLSIEKTPESGAKQRVELNPADCGLDFDIQGNGLQGHSLSEKGFAYCWSGARANVGINGGRYCFGCKVISAQPVEMEDTPPDQQHVCRVGISREDDAVGNLGETKHSFGFGGTGKFSNAGRFSGYGEKFGIGDTVVCTVNLESKPLATIGFSKNGKFLGPALQFDSGLMGIGLVKSQGRNLQWDSAVFPHVLLKNVVVQMQFSVEDGLVPEEGYKAWNCAFEEGDAVAGPTFSNRKDCEIVMMVGLPASGKTTWAEKWVKEHPEKRYILLGTNLALDQMKVPGLVRKKNYGERFDRLMDRATGIFNTLLARAAKMPRNYIIDQTNVYKTARKRKLKPFVNYHKIAVVVFPSPDELKHRAAKRFAEMGKEVPSEAVNEMLANFLLPMSKEMPGSDEFFDQVMFPELNRGESQRYLDNMKLELRSASNSNSKIPTYHRETSSQLCISPSPQNRGALSAPGGHWQNSPSPLTPAAYNHRMPHEVTSAYYAAGLHGKADFDSGDYQSVSADPKRLIATSRPYGNNPNYVRNCPPRDDRGPYDTYGAYDPYRRPNLQDGSHAPRVRTDSCQSYGGVDHYRKPYSESGTLPPRGGTDPYRSYAVIDQYGRPSSESRSHRGAEPSDRPNFERASSYPSDYGGPRTSLLHGGTDGDLAGEPQFSIQAPSEPTFQSHRLFSTSYGGSDLSHSCGEVDSFNNSDFQRASSYGSNHGIPSSSFLPGGTDHFATNPQFSMQAPRETAFEPHGPLSTSYGSSYGTPPGRSSYGNIPTTRLQHPGGYTPPGPRYH